MQPSRIHQFPEGIPTDTHTYRWVSVVLRVGMYASFAMMVGGQVWWMLAGSPGGDVVENIAIPVDRIVPELFALNPLALTSLGVVALLLTPGLTLFTSAVTYARARTWTFAALSAFLALVLTFGITLSLGWLGL
jgi:uncharacterized membrane protein